MTIDRVICTCTHADLHTFAVTSTFITKFIEANHYIVYVPEDTVEEAKTLVSGAFNILSEKDYYHILEYIKSKNNIKPERNGWYFQQFIKISELSKGEDSSVNLIWDADTAPLRKIIFSNNGLIFYYQGKEHHQPYFELIKNILGMEKIIDSSFIAQCFPARTTWVKNLILDVENIHKKEWYKAIIDKIDFNNSSGFSEYETLGTYISHKYSNEISINKDWKIWSRDGSKYIGKIDDLYKVAALLSKHLDHISFEKWQKRDKNILRRIKFKYFGR